MICYPLIKKEQFIFKLISNQQRISHEVTNNFRRINLFEKNRIIYITINIY